MGTKNEKKTNSLINPDWSKKQKILYFLWLDDQVMTYWSLYLDMKCGLPMHDFWTEEDMEKLDGYLQTIEYFESYQSELILEYTYEEIDEFVKNNLNMCKSFTFFRFFS